MTQEQEWSAVHNWLYSYAVQFSQARAEIRYLEVGVQEGHSLAAMLRCPSVRLAVGVDTWGDNYGGTNRGKPDHVIDLIGPTNRRRCLLISGNSHAILSGLRYEFDLAFVDGDHSEAGGLMDLEDTFPLMAPGGVILFDDIAHPKHPYLKEVAEKFARQHGCGIDIHPIGYGIAEIRL